MDINGLNSVRSSSECSLLPRTLPIESVPTDKMVLLANYPLDLHDVIIFCRRQFCDTMAEPSRGWWDSNKRWQMFWCIERIWGQPRLKMTGSSLLRRMKWRRQRKKEGEKACLRGETKGRGGWRIGFRHSRSPAGVLGAQTPDGSQNLLTMPHWPIRLMKTGWSI